LRRFLVGLVSFICFQYSFSQKTHSKIPYYPNEAIDFSLKYGIFNVGEAHLEFRFDQKCSGAYIQAYAKSSGLLKFIKDIYFRYECCMDTETGLPISDSRILIEGDYVDISTVYYDHLSRKDASLIYSKKTDTIVGPKNIYDLLSGFYRYRANYLGDNLPLNHTVSTTTFFIDKIRDLTIRYCGREIINTKYGNIECLKVKPVTIIGHFFRTSDAMTIWFTNSRKYIPVKFSIDLKLGTLYGNITDYKSLNIINELK
jgi:hypothetical protein